MLDLITYKINPIWDNKSVPKGFLTKHRTIEGTWGRLLVKEGLVTYYELDDNNEVILSKDILPNNYFLIHPLVFHYIKVASNSELQLHFMCKIEDYFRKAGNTSFHKKPFKF